MTPVEEIIRPTLNIPEVTPRLNLPDDLPSVIHPYPSREFPRTQVEPVLEVNIAQAKESRQKQAQILDKEGFGLPTRMRGVVESFVGIVVKNETSLFHNGDDKISLAGKEPASDLRYELRELMAGKCEDYFDEDGIIKKDKRNADGKIRTDIKTETGWNNIAGIAPKIAEILLTKEHNIKSVNRDQLKNIFSFAIDLAEDPSLLERTMISVGFGGSADSATSSRLPAYTLPAQLIATEINSFYQERLNGAIDKARVKKYQQEEIAKLRDVYGEAIPFLIEDNVYTTSAQALEWEKQAETWSERDTDEPFLPFLSQTELQEIKDLYAIPDKPLQLRFFSGAEAGIVSNFPGQETAVRTRREENWKVIQKFNDEHFPDLTPQIEFENDIPWEDHSVEQRTVLEYCAHLLRTSNKDSIKETLEFLEGLGYAKGKDNGKELAAEYAGQHVFFFLDQVNIPPLYTNFFGKSERVNEPEVTIMIGGKSEEMFCGIRDYIVEHASPSDLSDFVKEKAVRQELELITKYGERMLSADEISERDRAIIEINTLRNMADNLDTQDDSVKVTNRRKRTISLISATEIAPYYVGPGDEKYGVDLAAQIERIDQMDFIPNEPEYESIAIAAEIHAKAVKTNLEFIQRATKKAA